MAASVDPIARVEAILKRFFREPSDARAAAYAGEIVTVVTALTGGRDPTDTNRGKVTPTGQGAQDRMGGGFTPAA